MKKKKTKNKNKSMSLWSKLANRGLIPPQDYSLQTFRIVAKYTNTTELRDNLLNDPPLGGEWDENWLKAACDELFDRRVLGAKKLKL
jgi:hypothetical protein